MQVRRGHEHGSEDTIYLAIRIGLFVQNIIDERLETLKIGLGALWRETNTWEAIVE